MSDKQKKTKDDIEDDGRTIADMKDIDGASLNFLGFRANRFKDKKTNGQKENIENTGEPEFIPLTKKERRALIKAAWLTGLKVALIGTAILLAIFLLMYIIVYFWNK